MTLIVQPIPVRQIKAPIVQLETVLKQSYMIKQALGELIPAAVEVISRVFL